MMPIPTNATEVLSREFLPLRAKLIDVAASLDRIARAEGSAEDDPRMSQIRRSLQILAGPEGDFAERVQLVFSLPYDEQWRDSDTFKSSFQE